MTITDIIQYGLFGVLAAITVVSAFQVAATRSVMHAAFWLFPVFAGIAGFYLFLDAQFLAAIQVLLYIGAVLVLIVFAVTLTRNAVDPEEPQTNRFVIPVILAALVLLVALAGAILVTPWAPRAVLEGVTLASGIAVTEVPALGLMLLHRYLIPFEIISVLLLAAMIGAIVLARRERPDADTPVPADAEEPREPAQV